MRQGRGKRAQAKIDPSLVLDIRPGETPEHYRDRVIDATRADTSKRFRDTIDKLWRAVFTLGILLIVLCTIQGLNFLATQNSTTEVLKSRAQSSQGRALLCLGVKQVSNGAYGIPAFCKTPEVAQWLPPQTCPEFGNPVDCGKSYTE